ncbi:MAG: helix-turn-helix domain-containing protein [Crocinitomicaceae bacterium]|jgi:excisionase family DNA binding protein
MTEIITFEKLPEAVVMLTKEVSELKKLLIENQENSIKEQHEQLLTIQEASEFLSLSIATIYSKVSKGELPVMKGSKRLYFSNVELLNYLKQGRKKSKSEIETEAEVNLLNLKKGLNNGR